MSTSCTVKFVKEYDNDNQIELVNVYHHFNGYINGVGYQLAQWLMNKKLINGINQHTDGPDFANGADCLAAQYIRDFKLGVGGLYICAIDNVEDYNYRVIVHDYSDQIDIHAYIEKLYADNNNPATLKNDEHICIDDLYANADDVITIEVRIGNDQDPIFTGKPSELLEFQEPEDDK